MSLSLPQFICSQLEDREALIRMEPYLPTAEDTFRDGQGGSLNDRDLEASWLQRSFCCLLICHEKQRPSCMEHLWSIHSLG